MVACGTNRAPGHADEIILIEDFDSGSYDDWTAEGDAFAIGPRETKLVGRMAGGCAAGSSGRATGTLTSMPFAVERNAIYFLWGTREHEGDGSAGDLAVELLVDREVVRTLIPTSPSYKSHAMFWEAWDVADLKGKAARIRIVDNSDWADIVVDHIFQSDIPAERPVLERTLEITKPVLDFPVKNGAVRHYIELVVDGKPVRAIDVELATDEIDYWVVTDLSPWLGKELLIRTRQHPLANAHVLDRIAVDDGIRDAEDLYTEPLRPQFHFSTKRGWLNDPNGLVYYDGEYHLYYQHNPYGWDHSRNDVNKNWGHAVSTDLVHWKELPGAIYPDHLGPIYSGSSVVDQHNTAGFQTGKEKPIVAIYTSAGGRSPWSDGKSFSQSIAYSNDRGRTFTPYEGNPVLPYIGYTNRDPKVIWYEPTGNWVMVLYLQKGAMAFFTSHDLKTWEYQSEFEVRFQDCPELFQLPVDGDEQNKKWVLYGGIGDYFVGEFDGKKFTPESKQIRYGYYHGRSFYASQTFSDMTDGRRVQIAWGFLIHMPDMPFNQQMLFPVELSLRTTDDGIRLFAYPVREIARIHGEEHRWTDVEIEPGQNIVSGIVGDLYDIQAEFELVNANAFGFRVHGVTVKYSVDTGMLSCDKTKVALKPLDGKIRLRILVDRTTVEIFANGGQVYMPIRALPEANATGLALFEEGGKVLIRSLIVHELKSIWK
jgi:fructan beta-fructosidase